LWSLRYAMRILRRQKKASVNQARGHSHASADTNPTLSTFGDSLLALESRIMFDGAAVATVSTVTTEQISQSQAEESFSADDAATADTAPAAPTGEPPPTNGDQALFDALAAYDPAAMRQEILFVSSSVREYQQLLDGISPNVEVIVLDATRDGVEQMAEILAGRTGIDAIHIISHGSQAELALGTAHLTLESMNGAYADELAVIGQSLSEKADLLIYGCDFGQGEQGAEAAMRLGQLTGADVAASTDDTGHATLGGDWKLEYQTGQIETDVAVSAAFQEQWVGLLPTYTEFINYTSDVEIKDTKNWGQTFQHNSGSGTYTVNQISLALRQASGATQSDVITVTLRNSWNGSILASGTVTAASLGTTIAWIDFDIGNVVLNDNQSYTIRVSASTPDGKVYVGDNTSGGYAGGTKIDVNGSALPGEDLAFKVGLGAQLQAVGDTYIKLRSPDDTNNFGSSTSLLVDRESTDLQRALLQFDLSSIPANATINSATLQMQSTQIGGTLNISVYEILQAWTEGTGNGTAGEANWNQRVTGTNWTTAGGTFNSTAVANLNTSATGQHTWDITSLVQGWVDGSNSNNGLMVASPDGGGNRTVTYDSSEGTTPPVLVIDYSLSSSTPPLILNLLGDSLAYTEGDGAVVIDQGVITTVIDLDSPDFDTGTLIVSFVTGSDSAEDVLAIRNQGTGAGQIGVSGTTVTYGGTTIGTVAGGSGGSNLVVTFNSNATPSAAEALIRNITYENTDTDNPTTGARTVRFVVTDGDGGSSGNHDTTVTVSGVNDAPVGVPTITGTVTEDQTLTAVTAGISDADGLGAFSYQWLRNGVAVGGATASTYLLGNADVGALMSVRVTYTDGQGTAEGPLTSAQTAAVANLNDAPVIASNGGGATASVSVQENTVAVTTATSTDPDGGVPAYSIVGGADAARFIVNGGSGVLQFTVAPDFEAPTDAGANNIYVVTIQVDDGAGGTDTQTLTITIADVTEGLPPTTPLPPIPPSLVPQTPTPPSSGPPANGPPVSPAPIVVGTPIPGPQIPAAAWLGNSPSGSVPPTSEALVEPAQEGEKTAGPSLPLVRELRGYLEERVAPLIHQAGEEVQKAFGGQTLEEEPARISAAYRDRLNAFEEDLQRAVGTSESQRQLIVHVKTVAGVTLTAGFVTWLLRSGSLLASLATNLPAWRHVDPLSVVLVGSRERRKRERDAVAAAQLEGKQFRGLGTLLDHEGGRPGQGG
jgi:hypothetical protein